MQAVKYNIIHFSQWLYPYLGEISLAIMATLLVIYGNSINRMVKRQTHGLHFIFRTSIFILLCTFGYGALLVFFTPKKIARLIPTPLLALVVVTIISQLAGWQLLTIGTIPSGLPEISFPSFNFGQISIIVSAAMSLAVLGAIDSLLTSLVADNMTRTRHDSDKELVGQGIGNSIAGLFGAIPGAGATMRTVVNIRTGGQTKIAGILHALVLLAVVISLSPLASKIPHAVLAGILIKVGWDIIDVNYLKRAHMGPRWDLALMVLVLGLTVFVDLITAVAAGVILAALAFVKQLADQQLEQFRSGETSMSPEEQALLDKADGHVLLFDFGGPLSFGASTDLALRVRERAQEKGEAIVLDFSRVPFLDVSAARAVETIICDARVAERTIYITGMSDEVAGVLSGLDADHCLPADTHYSSRLEALRAAVDNWARERGSPPDDTGPTGAVPQPS